MSVEKDTARKVAKLATLVTLASYLNKIAEGMGEPVASDEVISEVVLRADEKLPGDISTTLTDPKVIDGIVAKIKEAAQEMEQQQGLIEASVQPSDVQLVGLGQGSVLQQLAANPHARTDGIEVVSAPKIIETNLMSVNKQAGGNLMNYQDLTKLASANPIAAIQHIIAKQAALQEVILKIAEEVEQIKTIADSAQNKDITPAPAAATSDATIVPKDVTLLAVPVTGDVNATGALDNNGGLDKNPNPASGKIAKASDILALINKHRH